VVEQKKTVLTGLILVVYQHNVEYKKKRLFLIERNKKPKQNAQEKLSKLKFDFTYFNLHHPCFFNIAFLNKI